MPLAPIQCPNCGAPVSVEPRARATTCAYCGSHLRVASERSGVLPASMLDAAVNSAIAAKVAAIGHLEQRARELEQFSASLPSAVLEGDRLESVLSLAPELRPLLDDLRRNLEQQREHPASWRVHAAYWGRRRTGMEGFDSEMQDATLAAQQGRWHAWGTQLPLGDAGLGAASSEMEREDWRRLQQQSSEMLAQARESLGAHAVSLRERLNELRTEVGDLADDQ